MFVLVLEIEGQLHFYKLQLIHILQITITSNYCERNYDYN